jgi:hypothetical protein
MAEPEMKRQDSPVLKRGDKSPDVQEAQGLLNRNGAILDPDGDFGGESADAVREFQAGRGIPVTGIVDAVTWRGLRALDRAVSRDSHACGVIYCPRGSWQPPSVRHEFAARLAWRSQWRDDRRHRLPARFLLLVETSPRLG